MFYNLRNTAEHMYHDGNAQSFLIHIATFYCCSHCGEERSWHNTRPALVTVAGHDVDIIANVPNSNLLAAELLTA